MDRLFCEEVVRACETLNIEHRLIEDASAVVDAVLRSFSSGGRGPFLWNRLEFSAEIASAHAWKLLSEILPATPVVIFFDLDEDRHAVEIPDGRRAADVLSESYGFECYFTTMEIDFVVCLNRFDLLLGAGSITDEMRKFA